MTAKEGAGLWDCVEGRFYPNKGGTAFNTPSKMCLDAARHGALFLGEALRPYVPALWQGVDD